MGLMATLNDSIGLLKNTFAVIARNPAIFKPTLAQIIIGTVIWLLLIGSFTILFLIQIPSLILISILMLLISVGLWILFPFIKMYYRAAQSWIVYNTFKGNNISHKDGIARARQNKTDIFILGLLEIMFNALAKKLKQGSGNSGGLWAILNILLKMTGALVEEAWDLVGHFLLPGSIIPEKTVGEALSDIKNLKNNVPASLVGALGIDFVGDAIRGYITFVFLLIFFAGFGVYYFTSSAALMIIGIALAILFNFIAKIFVDMVKTVYFTIFYVVLTVPEEIPEGIREEVTNYLELKA